jgi:hypothetical protein
MHEIPCVLITGESTHRECEIYVRVDMTPRCVDKAPLFA